MKSHRMTIGIRWLMMAVAFVAFSIAWSARFSDFTHRAERLAFAAKMQREIFVGEGRGITAESVARQLRRAAWDETSSRKLRRARWSPWLYEPTMPPRPD